MDHRRALQAPPAAREPAHQRVVVVLGALALTGCLMDLPELRALPAMRAELVRGIITGGSPTASRTR